MGKCDFVLEAVDLLAQLRRALRVEEYFSWGNQLPLEGQPPTWRAVSIADYKLGLFRGLR